MMNTSDCSQAAEVLRFLEAIAQHNDREWFAAHREWYEQARDSFSQMVEALLLRLTELDEGVNWLTVADCTYRFYRDTRFSPDKAPYKRHFGAYCNSRGRKSIHGGYYIHLQPGHCMVAGGAWCLPPAVLKAVREDIVLRIDEFRSIVEEPRFRALYPEIGDTALKTLPKGFDRQFPFPQYLRPKDYSVAHFVDDSFYCSADWLDRTMDCFAVMKPYLDFINETIDDYI